MARRFAGKTPEQLARAEAERAANARAQEEGRPLPFPNPWDVWDPTRVPLGATDEEIQERCRLFARLCAPRPRIVEAFRSETNPRQRLAPARRLLQVTAARALPEALADRLIDLASLPPDFRFLMNHVPHAAQADRLPQRVGDDPEAARIRKTRRFSSSGA